MGGLALLNLKDVNLLVRILEVRGHRPCSLETPFQDLGLAKESLSVPTIEIEESTKLF